MKRIVALTMIVLLSSLVVDARDQNVIPVDSKGRPLYADDEIAVIYKNVASVEEIKEFNEKMSCTLFYGEEGPNRLVGLRVPSWSNVEEMVSIYEKQSFVLIASLNTYDYLEFTPDDPHYQNDDQWHINQIHLDEAGSIWDFTTGDPDIKIAILDTGLKYDHEDLQLNTWSNPIDNTYNGLDDDGNGFVDDVHGFDVVSGSYDLNTIFDPFDDTGINDGDGVMDIGGHGTMVSGIIGATTNNGMGVAGIAGGNRSYLGCTILPVRYMNSNRGDVFDFMEAVSFSINQGVNIINMSFGSLNYGLENPIRKAACSLAYNQFDVLLIASAGNDNLDNVMSPADYSSVVAVAATDDHNVRCDTEDWGTNPPQGSHYGPEIELAAPGDHIWTTTNINPPYDWNSGTSFSSPIVAGLAGLLWSKYLGWTNEQVRAMLRAGATYIEDADGDDDLPPNTPPDLEPPNDYVGYGVIDGSQFSPIRIALTPNTTIIQPGSQLIVQFDLENITHVSQNFHYKVWVETSNQNEIILEEGNLTFRQFQKWTGPIAWDVPGSTPLGTYTFFVNVGFSEDIEYQRDSFGFAVVSEPPLPEVWRTSGTLVDCDGPVDEDDNWWYEDEFDDSGWEAVTLPNSNWGCNDCDRYYRYNIFMPVINNGVEIIFRSDDGIWIYVNETYIGHWGGDCHEGGTSNTSINITPYLRPENNLIAVHVSERGGGENFDLTVQPTLLASPLVNDCDGPIDFEGDYWYEWDFDDTVWTPVLLPNSWGQFLPPDRYFRFILQAWSIGNNPTISFASDDGIRVFINEEYLGEWGAGCHGARCVNGGCGGCTNNVNVPPVDISDYLNIGENLIAIHVTDGNIGGCFNYVSFDDITGSLY